MIGLTFFLFCGMMIPYGKKKNCKKMDFLLYISKEILDFPDVLSGLPEGF